jgi:hypothetical protein
LAAADSGHDGQRIRGRQRDAAGCSPGEGGVFRDINCPVIGTDVNDDGVFADIRNSQELVRFPNVDWDGDGLSDDGIQDPDSTLQ